MLDSRRNCSIHDNKDFLDLLLENGQNHGGGSSNNRTQKTPLSIGYSTNPTSPKNEDHVSTTTKRARLSTASHSLLDHHFTAQTQRDSDMASLHQINGKVSSPFKKPRNDSSQTPPTRVVNFSNFSIPAVFLKYSHQNSAGNIASSSARVEEIKSKAAVIETVQEQNTTLTPNISNLAPLAEKRAKPLSSLEALREKGKANTKLCNPQASFSVCSLAASNEEPTFGSIWKLEEDTDDISTYYSDNEEEPESMVKERPSDEIAEKICKLKELLPNCDKVDKASMLEDAIDYVKNLKLQLGIISMANGLCMPPMMMVPLHYMNAAQLMGGGMGFRPPQFPNIQPAVLPGVRDNNIFQMFGFSNQIPTMPMTANAPFINPMMNGNSSTQQPVMETTNNLARHVASPDELTTQDYTFQK